jgi:hypothetical protein
MSPRVRSSGLLLLVAALLPSAGCSDWNVHKLAFWSSGDDEPQAPTKVVAMWTDTVLYQPGKPTTRGFGGRLMFYGSKKAASSDKKEAEKPVKVDGTLVVYALDETGRKKGNSKPDRKFIFIPEQFQQHYSKSAIGHSYSVWVPWDEAGGPQHEISLIVRFMPKKGDVLVGEQTTQILPGAQTQTADKKAAPPPNPADGIRRVSHEEEIPQPPADAAGQTAPPAVEPGTKMQATTIHIPQRSGLRATPAAALRATSPPPEGRSSDPRPSSTTSPPVPLSTGQPATNSTAPRSTRFEPAKRRALGEPIARPRDDRALSPPALAAPASSPGMPPSATVP